MAAVGMAPDPWQAEALDCDSKRILICAARQSGKSQVVGARVLADALERPGSFVLIVSPTLRQSGELFREKVLTMYRAAGSPLYASRPTQLELRLANGSRVISLPESESGIRCFAGVTTLVIDEASRVDDGLYKAVRPMLATRDGAIIALSTPNGQRGFFYEAWAGSGAWRRIRAPAALCPRLTPEFLAEERLDLGPQWYAQEYDCDFSTQAGALWPGEYFLDGIWYDEAPGPFLRSVLSIDTSRGKITSDYQALVLGRLDLLGHHWVDADLVKLDDERFVRHCVARIEEWQPDVSVIETNAGGAAVFARLASTLIGGRYPIVVGRYHASTENKQVRIAATLTSQLSRGTIHLRRGSPGCRLLLQQMREFPLAEYADGPDALQMGLELQKELLLPPAKRTVKYEQAPRLSG
jgi:hypothetical protein